MYSLNIAWVDYTGLQCCSFEFKKIICLSGSGAAKSPKGQPSGEGLCQGLPGFYVQVHLWQLPWTLFPTNRPGKKKMCITFCL